jgi:hypothetical protein
MIVKPKEYNKQEFLKFLDKNGVNKELISKFKKIPERLRIDDSTFKLNIHSRWYDIGNTYYEFELNYYSPKLMEYLFNFKVYKDVEISINHLICELKRRGFWDDPDENC